MHDLHATAFLEVGVASRPRPGETVCGDAYVVSAARDSVLTGVVDGLGHGEAAASAARRAAETIAKHRSLSVIALVRQCHQELIGTRGVVLNVAAFNVVDDTMSWLGVGNVQGVLVRADPGALIRHENILVRGGVVGLQLPALQAMVTDIAPGDLVVFATDGIRPDFAGQLDTTLPAQRLADHVLNTYAKDTDDALVLAARYCGAHQAPR